MSTPTVRSPNPHVHCQVIYTQFGADGNVAIPMGTEEVPAAAPKVLTAEDFPRELVEAIGKETLDQLLQIDVQEKGMGYLDGCFSMDMIPAGGAIKGTDQNGRPFITFAVTSPRFEEIVEARRAAQASNNHDLPWRAPQETVLVTFFKRFVDRPGWLLIDCPRIPTNDPRFLKGGFDLNFDKCAVIKEIFNGTHPDLMLFKNQPPASAVKA